MMPKGVHSGELMSSNFRIISFISKKVANGMVLVIWEGNLSFGT